MAYEIDDDVMPLFLINGFLEAGKTQFLDFTMRQDYFKTDGKTLLIVCEEGDTEYDAKMLKKNRTAVVFVDSMEKLTPQYLDELEVIYRPEIPPHATSFFFFVAFGRFQQYRVASSRITTTKQALTTTAKSPPANSSR